MKRLAFFAVLALATSATIAADAPRRANPQAVVEAVQMPAWIYHGNARTPLAPETELRADDKIVTGANARLLVKLAEGSSVKLGENAQLRIADVRTRGDNVFVAAMSVLAGAFRFTTDALAKARARDVSITVATVTAGIRGTDFWGKASSDRDIVCLIEGKLELQRSGDVNVAMDQPLTFYVAPRGQPPQAVQPVDPGQLKTWAAEVDIEAGRGAARRGGRWQVVLASSESQREALKVYEAVREAGYAAQIAPVKAQDKRVYDVRVASLPSRAEAQALADALAGKYGVASPRVIQ
jgi:cell division septation protein DedD